MSRREASRSIDEAASGWAARLDRAPLTPDEDAVLKAWLDADPRCAGALLRAQAYALLSESARALGPHYDPQDFVENRRVAETSLSRRRLLRWGGAGAAGAALAGWGVSLSSANAAITTARGELRLIPLSNGSTVMLNTASSIRLARDPAAREASLIEGEAYFSIVEDQRGPFSIGVAGRTVQASRAGFRVRKLAHGPVELLVHDGVVRLQPDGWSGDRPLILNANMQIALARQGLLPVMAAGRPSAVSPDAVTRDLAWREGKIAFEGTTLQQAAESFARYSERRIVIPDPGLASESISGLFAANDPLGFSVAVAKIFDGKVRQEGELILLSRGVMSP